MCHLRTQNGTNLQENTFAYKWGTRPTIADLLTLAAGVANNIGAALRLATWTGIRFTEVYCRNIDTEVAAEGTFQWPSNTFGQRGGNPLAANEACGIVKRTGNTGRGQHGRTSISNFVEGDVDGNTVSSTLIALLAQVAIEMLISFLSSNLKPAIAHIPRITGTGTSDPIQTTIVLDSNVDSQKTRLNSHGR